MRNRNYRQTGRNIRHTVRDAVRSGNFENVGQAVQSGVQEITNSVNGVLDSLTGAGRPPYPYTQNRPQNGPFTSGENGWPSSPVYRDPSMRSAFCDRMPGSVSGLVCAIIGIVLGIPLLILDISVFAVGIADAMPFENYAAGVSVLTPFTIASFCLMGYGITMRHRARRFARYRDAMENAAFCTVAKLADAVGLAPELTKKDLRKMITSGACPHGHLDRSETCFMVDDETYDEYLDAEKAYAERSQAAHDEEQKKEADPKEAELEAVKKEGSKYLQQIRAVNDTLPGKEISDKLDRLENVSARIFVCVEQHPEKLPDIRSFMHYYLPTTLKLVKSYEEFEAQPVQGENITKAKAEIEKALDTINAAFGNLLDTLFADDALDISADISTLETMLKQGGLTGSDFAKAPDESKPE